MKVQLKTGYFFDTEDILHVSRIYSNNTSYYFLICFKSTHNDPIRVHEDIFDWNDADAWDKLPIETRRQIMNKAETLIKKTHEELRDAWSHGYGYTSIS